MDEGRQLDLLPPLKAGGSTRVGPTAVTPLRVIAPVGGEMYKNGDVVDVLWTFDVAGGYAFVIELVGLTNGKVIRIEPEVRR
jgi:hypothetical protein